MKELVPDSEMNDPRWFQPGGEHLIPKSPEEAERLRSAAREVIEATGFIVKEYSE